MRIPVLATFLGVLTLQTAGQGQAPASSQPTFRAGTTVVEVSAIVSRDGRPVSDLRADEITVLDNGVAQPLVAFDYVDLALIEGPAQRRDFVLVLDDLHVGAARTTPAIAAALALVDALGAHDRLAIANTGLGDLTLDLTTDREPARRLIRKFRGQAGSVSTFEAETRTRTAMQLLMDTAVALRSAAAERRAVLLISEGHAAFSQESRVGLNPAGQAAFQDYLGVIREAALSNVAIYAVDPRGLLAPGGAQFASRDAATTVGQQSQTTGDREIFGSLAILAQNTGGLRTLWTNDLTAVIPQMLQDSRQYYRLAYLQPDPRPGKRQPSSRSIKVTVSRDVDVRARQRYAPTGVALP